MSAGLTRHIRESFSAKVIVLVAGSVLITSLVVGVVTTSTTKKFLVEKASEKFPSTLTSTYSRIRSWYASQARDLDELCASTVFRQSIRSYQDRQANGGDAARERQEIARYLILIHGKFPVYEEILLFDGDARLVAATSPADELGSQEEVVAGLIRERGRIRPFSEAHFRGDLMKVYQWMLVPITVTDDSACWLAASVSLEHLGAILGDVSLGAVGDMYVLDGQGRFLTQPRREERNVLREHAMQVPTRQEGPIAVEIRKDYHGRKVFHSKVHLEEHGWWLVYDADYRAAVAPVISAQQQIWVAVLLIGALAVAVALRIVRSILQPIRSLALGARRINEGLVGVKIPRGSSDEIGLLTDTFNEMAMTITLSKAELQYKNKMLNSQNDQLQDMNVRLEQLSVTDGLTGLFNHRHFWNILDQELARVDRYKGELALILVDLDDFKRVNDQFGHSVGDLLLQSVSRILRETVRDTDVVARYGGEEFAILLPETDRPGVESVAEKLRESVEAMRFTVPDSDINLRVTVSVGISVFRGNRREFFNSADKALYQSKAGGKNRVNFAVA